MKLLISIILLILTSSCSYRWTFKTNPPWTKYLAKEYKNEADQRAYGEKLEKKYLEKFKRENQKQQEKREKRVFKKIKSIKIDENGKRIFTYFKYKPKIHPRYSENISLVSNQNIQGVKFDSVIVNFSQEAGKYIDFFSTGVLYPEVINCSRHISCPSFTSKFVIDVKTGKQVELIGQNEYTHFMNVIFIEEPEHLKVSPKRRRFILHIKADEISKDYYEFFFEVTNPKINKYVDSKEFLKNATLTYMYFGGIIIFPKEICP